MRLIFGRADEEPRDKGSVLFADPCTPTFTRAINPPISPIAANAGPTRAQRIESMTGNLMPWEDRTGFRAQESWAAMNAKRGIPEAESD